MGITARIPAVLSVAALAVGLAAAPAFGHATANPGEGPAGDYAKFEFRIGHGCEGSPTTRVAISIPPGVVFVKPQVTSGWEIETVTGPYDEPVELYGEEITEGVEEVSWTGGPLPDDHMQEFGLSVRLPDRPGETIYFPTVQTCEVGEHRWITIPVEGEEEPEEPAPAVTLLAAGDDRAGGGGAEPASSEAPAPGGGEDDAATLAGNVEDGGPDTLAVIALVVAVAGVLLGGAALGMARKNA